MVENGPVPELLLANEYGHKPHVFDLKRRTHVQELDLGAQYQMALELRPAHDPTKKYGFVGVVVSTDDLSGSIWCWLRDGDGFAVTKVFDIPAEPTDPDQLPDALKPFGAVPPLITDIDLSVDDRFLYVSCFGTGEANSSTCPTPSSRRRPARSGSAGSPAAPRTRRGRTCHCPARRRWWRSAATGANQVSAPE